MKWILPGDSGLSKWTYCNSTKDGGIKISRVSEYWLKRITMKISEQAWKTAGIQLQFQTDSNRLTFRYSCISDKTQKISFLLDNRLYEEYEIQTGEDGIKEIDILLDGMASKLVNVVLPYSAEMTLYGIGIDDNASLTPYADERKIVCFYGDSITHGSCATSQVNTYPYLVGQKLNVQTINQGYGGSAFPDPSIGTFLSKDISWDALCIAIGTNTYAQGYESDIEFKKLYRVFLELTRQHKPKQPIFCITPIWRGNADRDGRLNSRNNSLQDYRNATTRAVQELQKSDSNLYLIDGLSLINSERGLSQDCLHPDDLGMELIAEGIVRELRSRIGGKSIL